jgi:hypothetical protein
MLPHALEGFGERLYVGRLRADVYVYSADVDQLRVPEAAAEGV